MTEWSIQEIARSAGVTSRTLRHYDAEGIVPPTRIGQNGYRYYDESALVRLQRVLLLRDLGLGIPAIRDALAAQDDNSALTRHLEWLRQEQQRLARQIASVERTIAQKGALMPTEMFDGFDHTEYRDEVEQLWGADAYAAGDRWWRGMTADEKAAWKQRQAALLADWKAAAASLDQDAGRALAARHYAWLAAIPGTPGYGAGGPPQAYFRGLAGMYADDPRFAANYGGEPGAAFVRDAMLAWADEHWGKPA